MDEGWSLINGERCAVRKKCYEVGEWSSKAYREFVFIKAEDAESVRPMCECTWRRSFRLVLKLSRRTAQDSTNQK